MGAGKTTLLIQLAAHLRSMDNRTVVLIPRIASTPRFAAGKGPNHAGKCVIASRSGAMCNAYVISEDETLDAVLQRVNADMKWYLGDPKTTSEATTVVLIDEAQFLSSAQVNECSLLTCVSLTIKCFGLKSNCLGALFDGDLPPSWR